MTETGSQRLGIVVSGSLNKGIDARLDGLASVEDMAVGRYVTIEGQKQRFLGMITDISLGVTDENIIMSPPDMSDPLTAAVLNGTSTYGTLHIAPYLCIGGKAENMINGPQPVKTVPSHFSIVNLASQADVELVFGKEGAQNFWIGSPLDMEMKLCLDLEKLVTRSNGIFGKSGTGKTFLTRILLIGMMQKSKAVNLIFDMHSEYGWSGTREGGPPVHGLKHFGQSKVAIFTLDEVSSRRKGFSPDFVVRIGYSDIQPEDIVLLSQTLNLTEPAVGAVYQLYNRFGNSWFKETIAQKDSKITAELLEELKIHEKTFQNLYRGLMRIVNRLKFIEPETSINAVNAILEHLDRGVNVVLEFGRYRDINAYVLVANMLSRRIYDRYQEKTEIAMAEGTSPPIPLVITIEEAHKFLSPEVANQTTFGNIAREMRKFNVTLLLIDQRPSSIDTEIMSQLGTKITCLIDDDRDIESVLAGVSGKNELRTVLAKLAPKQQALIFGHSVLMPVAFKPREYGSAESYGEFSKGTEIDKQAGKDIEDLWGD